MKKITIENPGLEINNEKDRIQHQYFWYRPIANTEEIKRIIEPKNANDYLLNLRANIITAEENNRLFRVYRHKKKITEAKGLPWSLEGSFKSNHYESWLSKIPKKEGDICKNLCFGNVFSTDPHGRIFSTVHGPIITICDSLSLFSKFAQLALLFFSEEVPFDVRTQAIKISIRIMARQESMDFDLDPRGIIPKSIECEIERLNNLQLEWIAGHEFSHYILGHLDESKIHTSAPVLSMFNEEFFSKNHKIYSINQQHEFDADLHSLMLPKYSELYRYSVRDAAIKWLSALEIFEAVKEYIDPEVPWKAQHPPARDRALNLIKALPFKDKSEEQSYAFLTYVVDKFKHFMLDDVAYNIELYEDNDDYDSSSMYLDHPDTDWRGKELIDRVDF